MKPQQHTASSDMAMILKFLQGQKRKPAVLPISVYTDRAYHQSVNSEPIHKPLPQPSIIRVDIQDRNKTTNDMLLNKTKPIKIPEKDPIKTKPIKPIPLTNVSEV